jgi:hypothetical protein
LTASGTFAPAALARALESRPRTPSSPPPMASTRATPRSLPRCPVAANPYSSRGSHLAGAHCLAHTVAHALTHPRTGLGHQHRRRADAAAPMPAMASRDGHHPGLAPLWSPAAWEVPCGFPFWPVAQAPWDSPPARSSRAAVSLSWAFLRAPRGTVGFTDSCCASVTTCGRGHSRSAGIRCG